MYNVSYNKKISCNNPQITNLNNILGPEISENNTNQDDYAGQYYQIDLLDNYTIDTIILWHTNSTNTTATIQVSTDDINYIKISDISYRPRSTGKTIKFYPTMCRYIKIYTINLKYIESWTSTTQSINLAYKKPYTKSALPEATYPDKNYSTDGDTEKSYGYIVGNSITIDIIVNLETKFLVNKIGYYFGEEYFYKPDTVNVSYSLDNINFTTIGDINLQDAWSYITCDNMFTQYIKLQFTKSYHKFGDEWLFINEIEVFGPDPPVNVALGKSYLTTIESDPKLIISQSEFSEIFSIDLHNYYLIDFKMNFIQNISKYIYLPDTVSLQYSSDGILYTDLGKATKKGNTFTMAFNKLLVYAKYFKVVIQNINKNTQYTNIYIDVYQDVAIGKQYISSVDANSVYSDTAGELTDGIKVSTDLFNDPSWQGRWDTDYYHIVNLQKNQQIDKISINFFEQKIYGILLPTSVIFSVSVDNITYKQLPLPILNKNTFILQLDSPTLAQYIKMFVHGDQWIFEDELEIWGYNNIINNPPIYITIPSNSVYPDINNELTDGLYAKNIFNDSNWSGRLYEPKYSHIIDLGISSFIDKISQNFYQFIQYGIYWPDFLTFYCSVDGITYKCLGNANNFIYGNDTKMFIFTYPDGFFARYIKISITNNQAWTFSDEIEIWNIVGKQPEHRGVPNSDNILSIIPYPKYVQKLGDTLNIGTIIRYNDPSLSPLCDILMNDIYLLCGVNLYIIYDPIVPYGTCNDGDILLYLRPYQSKGYSLDITYTITISASSYSNMVMGTITLLQLLCKSTTLPQLHIQDYPTLEYRSIMIDVARQYHSIDTLKKIVLSCRLYKINYLHLHLSDHNAWTFPSTLYPELGKSNYAAHSGVVPIVYDINDLIEFVNFAKNRGVIVIPEINTPGHCSILSADRPDIFGGYDSNNTLVTYGYVNMVNENTYSVMNSIYGELLQVFNTTPYIIIGGDEASFSNIENIVGYESFMNQHNLENNDELYAYWIDRMRGYVSALGKQAIGWEGYYSRQSAQKIIDKSLILINWHGQNYAANDMIMDGFKVINCPWKISNIYEWDVYSFNSSESGDPEINNIEIGEKANVLGAVYSIWEKAEDATLSIVKKEPGIRMERVYNPLDDRSYSDLCVRMNTIKILE